MSGNPQQVAKKGALGESGHRVLSGFDTVQGGAIPGTDRTAYSLLMPQGTSVPIVISIPHAGRAYPCELLRQMRDPERAALLLEDRYVDSLGEAIAQETGATLLIAEAPRAMLDLNRAPDDIDWSMIAGAPPTQVRHSLGNRRARSGLGLIPRKLARVGDIWRQRLDFSELTQRLQSVHVPYHVELARVLSEMRDRWGAALLIDLHSMPPLVEEASPLPAPQLVIGDRFGASCAADLSALALNQLGRCRAVAHNLPYAGGYVLDRHGAPKRGIHALQVEVCRTAYLDQEMRQLGVRFAAVARELAAFIGTIGEEVAWLGRPQSCLAAE